MQYVHLSKIQTAVNLEWLASKNLRFLFKIIIRTATSLRTLCLLLQFVSAEGNDVVPLKFADRHNTETIGSLEKMKVPELFGMFT